MKKLHNFVIMKHYFWNLFFCKCDNISIDQIRFPTNNVQLIKILNKNTLRI